MPDPVRAARTAVRTVESMGVPFTAACAIVGLVCVDAAQAVTTVESADNSWLYEVGRQVRELSARPITSQPRALRAATEQLISQMDGLGYAWSTNLGRFVRDDDYAG